jgi:hypothetical protein
LDPRRRYDSSWHPQCGSSEDRQQKCSRGVGYDKAYVAVVGASHLTYAENLLDEQKPSVISFLCGAVALFNGTSEWFI